MNPIISAGLALVLPLLCADDEFGPEEKLITLTGVVRKVEKRPEAQKDDKSVIPSFTVKAGGKTLGVTASEKGTLTMTHEAIPLTKVEPDSTVFVLGRKQESTRIPETSHDLPPQIVNIVTLVVAPPGWEPPPLSADLKERKVEWMKGLLHVQGSLLKLDSTNMQIGRDRLVIKVRAPKPEDLRKKVPVRLTGHMVEGAKPRKMIAKEIIFLSRKIKAKEYRAILGN